MEVAVGFQGFRVDFVEAGNVVVPLEQRGGGAAAIDGARVEIPDRIDHRVVVRVEDVLLVLGVAGDVNLGNAMRGHGVDVIHGVKFVIHRGDVDVVDIEENAAVAALDDFAQKLPLGHLGAGERRVATYVFDSDGDFEK